MNLLYFAILLPKFSLCIYFLNTISVNKIQNTHGDNLLRTLYRKLVTLQAVKAENLLQEDFFWNQCSLTMYKFERLLILNTGNLKWMKQNVVHPASDSDSCRMTVQVFRWWLNFNLFQRLEEAIFEATPSGNLLFPNHVLNIVWFSSCILWSIKMHKEIS